MSTEKAPDGPVSVSHVEDTTTSQAQQAHQAHQIEALNAELIKGRDFTKPQEEVPPGYWHSVRFIGTVSAIVLAMSCGQGGFSLIAPVLGLINEDIGPDGNVIWVALVYLLTTSIGLVLVGRITDIFGRRWFFIGGNAIGTIGAIISATAPNVPALIAGMTFIGAGASTQLSYGCKLFPVLFELRRTNLRSSRHRRDCSYQVSLLCSSFGVRVQCP
jgi:hypothetical protein